MAPVEKVIRQTDFNGHREGASRRFSISDVPSDDGGPPDETTLADIDALCEGTLCEWTGEPNSKGGLGLARAPSS
jgi:hypothetical protein